MTSADEAEMCSPIKADEEQYLDHLKKVNDVFYDQIRLADQKAAYIFTFTLAFVVTSAEGRGVFNITRYTTGNILPSLFSGLLATALIISMVSAITVVLPRKGARPTSLYWGGWKENRETFLKAHGCLDGGYLFAQYLGNVDALAAINRSKYRSVSLAFRSLIVSVVSYVGLLASS
ncbi:Pycsar system effector family protein [Arvimicrobium flavum]|uniref:Pycsar system effector family protein n=1 Tax=Arvimicrobium flavum TaxID=3393320 RepID=UPI00237C4B2A|nr:Pycsar system effector family protein [Mesorhizobium shangrilense]